MLDAPLGGITTGVMFAIAIVVGLVALNAALETREQCAACAPTVVEEPRGVPPLLTE